MRFASLLMVMLLISSVNFAGRSQLKKGSPEYKAVLKKIEARRLKRAQEKMSQNGQGKLVLFFVSEWARKCKLNHLELYPTAEMGNKSKMIKVPKVESVQVGSEKVEGDNVVGGLLGFMVRGNRNQAVYRQVYMTALDLPAGEYDYTVVVPRKKRKHRKSMNLIPLTISKGRTNIFTHHWGSDRLIDTRLANTKNFEEAVDKFLIEYKDTADNWPIVKPATNDLLKLKLDMDYRERQHARAPKVIIYDATLKDGVNKIAGHVVYETIKSFGNSDNRYTHTYYTVEFDKTKLATDKCYDLELKGLSILNGQEVKKFEPKGTISGQKLVCPGAEVVMDVKGQRVTGSEWQLNL